MLCGAILNVICNIRTIYPIKFHSFKKIKKSFKKMNKLKTVFWLTLALIQPKLFADEIVLTAKNTEVRVFLQQAQITAQVKASLASGKHTLIIENIANTIEPSSIQLAGEGDLTILSTRYGQNFVSSPKNSAKLKNLKDSLNTNLENQRFLQLNLETFEREKDLLKANYSVQNNNLGASPDKVKAMADFFRLRMADINQNILKTEKQVNQAKEKTEKLQQQIKELNEIRPSVGQIMVEIMANSKGTASLELSYIAYNAGWAPVYDIRADNIKSNINLHYKANVWQLTGIDWEQVKLTLSTTNPSLGGNKPELGTQWVDFYQAPMYRQSEYKSRAGGAAPMMNDAAAPAMEAMVVQSTADITKMVETSLALNFDIAIPYTINHGGSQQLVDIQKHSLVGNFTHYAAPKLDNDAFLIAQISGWEQYNLLPGQAKVFFEGAYVGETYVNAMGTSDTLKLGMGRDKKVILKREKVTDFTSKKTIGSSIKESYGYKITIRNTKKESVNLVLEDQVPISQNKDIEVFEKSYAGASIDEATGKVSWALQLKPNETKVLELKYSIKYPKGKVITGL